VQPDNVAALMLLGVLDEQTGKTAEARKAYEEVLAAQPRFAPAANNLAWLLAETGGDLERAWQLARVAREAAPAEPHVADTLGWILHRRGMYEAALPLLKESLAKLPDNPEIQYHLGLTYARIGDRDNARRVLASAASTPRATPVREQAQRALAELK
jgi:Flp pilus assembly protein TadD